MSETRRYLVRLPLTDKQIEIFVQGSECGSTPDDVIGAIGTPVEVAGLKPLAYRHIRTGHLSHAEPLAENVNLVRQADAVAQIAIRDAEIADLKAHADTVISFDEAYRRKVERRVLPGAMGDMMKIADLIEWAKKIHDQFGNTCIYAVDLSWGAVALNREADDRQRLSPGKTSWTDNPDFEGADAEAAFAALKEENSVLSAENERLRDALSTAPQPAPGQSDRGGRDGLKADMFWAADDGENGANDPNIVMEGYDPFEPVQMQTGFFGPDIWGFHNGTSSFVFATEAECRAAIDAAMDREDRGDA